jgi:hypothetical protein
MRPAGSGVAEVMTMPGEAPDDAVVAQLAVEVARH